MFEEALKHEFSFPPKFGQTTINYYMIGDALPPGFATQYRRRVQEYNTPWNLRVHCPNLTSVPVLKLQGRDPETEFNVYTVGSLKEPCGNFVGEASNRKQIVFCSLCKGACVLHKSKQIGPIDAAAFEGLTRGRDYQLCPGTRCNVVLELAEACNFLRCKMCGTGSCFICGEKTEHNSNHWSEGKPCPRWNQPGAKNAGFDDRPERRPLELRVEEFREHPADEAVFRNWAPQHWVTGDAMVLGVFRDQTAQVVHHHEGRGEMPPRWAVRLRALSTMMRENLVLYMMLATPARQGLTLEGNFSQLYTEYQDIMRRLSELPWAEVDQAMGARPRLATVRMRYQRALSRFIEETMVELTIDIRVRDHPTDNWWLATDWKVLTQARKDAESIVTNWHGSHASPHFIQDVTIISMKMVSNYVVYASHINGAMKVSRSVLSEMQSRHRDIMRGNGLMRMAELATYCKDLEMPNDYKEVTSRYVSRFAAVLAMLEHELQAEHEPQPKHERQVEVVAAIGIRVPLWMRGVLPDWLRR